MAKVRTNQKVLRAVRFLMGLRDPATSQVLVPYGLTQSELTIAHQLVRAATEPRLNQRKGGAVHVAMMAKLNAVDHHWYPIIKYALMRRSRAMADWAFLNLGRTQGMDLVITLKTLFARLEQLEEGTSPFEAEGQLAFATLQERGLQGETLEEIRDLLDSIESFGPTDGYNPIQYQQAIDKLWGWYLEWGGIARTVIKDPRLLRMLGFRRTKSGPHITPEQEQEEIDASEPTVTTQLPATTQPTTNDVATAAPPNGGADGAVLNGAASNGAALNGASSNGAAHA